MHFADLVATSAAVAATTKRSEKIALLAAYFHTLPDEDLSAACLFLTGSPFPAGDARRLNVGWAALVEVITELAGGADGMHDAYLRHGDLGLVTEELLAARQPEGDPLTVHRVGELFAAIERDDEDAAPVAVVNRTLADRFWGSAEAAIGKRVRLGDHEWRTVVGVASDVKYLRIDEQPRPYVYVPFPQSYRPRMVLHMRGAAPDDRLVEQARAAVAAGATLINDVSASLHEVAADLGVGWVAMHMQGEPGTMQDNPVYGDVVREVHGYLAERIAAATAAGIDRSRIVADPGFGFGKTLDSLTDVLMKDMDQKKRETLDSVAKASHDMVNRTMEGMDMLDPRQVMKASSDLLQKTSDVTAKWVSKAAEAVEKAKTMPGAKAAVTEVRKAFETAFPGDASQTQATLKAAMKASGTKGKDFFMPVRLALTDVEHGPEMNRLIPLIGRERCLRRLEVFLGALG